MAGSNMFYRHQLKFHVFRKVCDDLLIYSFNFTPFSYILEIQAIRLTHRRNLFSLGHHSIQAHRRFTIHMGCHNAWLDE